MRLTLYHYPTCPFCWRVNRARKKLGVEFDDDKNIHRDSAAREELLQATGRTTVPVLKIEKDDGEVTWLPESLDIIAFLQTQFG